jgi:hypothetical protein
VLHGVREKRRESERSLKSSKECEDVVTVFTPCRYLIVSIQLIFVRESHLQVVCIVFLFFMIFGVLSPDFSSASLEEFFFNFFYGFGCLDEPHHLSATLE